MGRTRPVNLNVGALWVQRRPSSEGWLVDLSPIGTPTVTVAMLTKTAQKWVGKIAQWTLIYSTTFQNGEAISGAACLL
jgi:hypothetical protein